MANHAYIRGRALEWRIQRLFKDAGHLALRSAGSHGLADLIVSRSGDAIDMMKPLSLDDMVEVLDGYMEVHDQKLILEPFMYARRKYLARGGEQYIHFTPVSAWYLQLKSKKGK